MDKELIWIHDMYLSFISDLIQHRENACVAWDFDGRFIHCNKQFARLLGMNQKEVIGKSFIEMVHPEDQRKSQDEYDKNTQGGFNLMHRFVNRYKHKDGHWVWLCWLLAFNNVKYKGGAGEVRLANENEIPKS